MLNPPVDIVVIEWTTASNNLRPEARYANTAKTVKPRYTKKTDWAISLAFGNACPKLLKLSNWKICIPPTLKRGKKITATTIIPIPPNHWSNPRQNNRPSGKVSRTLKTVAPVVVKPDIDSKKPSTKLALDQPIINGIEPKIGNINQIETVNKNVCWIEKLVGKLFEQLKINNAPEVIVMKEEYPKIFQCSSLK